MNAAGDRVRGFPAGAVSGDDQVGCELLEGADGVGDDRLEQRAGEVEPADDRVQLADAGQALGVPADVDHAGVPAACQDDQPVSGDVARCRRAQNSGWMSTGRFSRPMRPDSPAVWSKWP